MVLTVYDRCRRATPPTPFKLCLFSDRHVPTPTMRAYTGSGLPLVLDRIRLCLGCGACTLRRKCCID